MTYGQLFREVAEAIGLPSNEETARQADTIVPDLATTEIPPEQLEEVRAHILATANAFAPKLKAMSPEEMQAVINRITSKN